MSKEHLSHEEKKARLLKAEQEKPGKAQAADPGVDGSGLTHLQNQMGNQAVQRLIAQRSGGGPTELDEETANRINQERGGGQPLDGTVQAQMGETLGYDFSGVKVHTSPQADELNQQLGAKAFTTGKDLFFREGAYEPHSTEGHELLAHELTHVVQQGSGKVQSGGRMAVNEPGDVHEQEANSVAKQATSLGAAAQVQRQEVEEEEVVQEQAEDEEEEVVQEQAEDEEEVVQEQEMDEDEEAM